MNNGTLIRARNAKAAENAAIDAQTTSMRSAKMHPHSMFRYALMFLASAVIAAVLGFGFMAGAAAWSAKMLFVVFLLLFVITIIGPPKQQI